MMAGKDTELQQEGKKPLNYQNLASASMASMGNALMNISACSSAPMVDSFGPFMWEHRLDASNFSYSNMNFHNVGTSTSSPSLRADMGLHQDLVLRKDMSQTSFPSGPFERAPHLPTDSDFIERAARLSSFGGSFAQMLSPFPLPHSMSPFALKQVTGMRSQRDEKNVTEDGKLLKNVKKCGASGNESDDAEYSHERQADDTPENSTPKGLDSKKRKKHAEQDYLVSSPTMVFKDENNKAAMLTLQRNNESEYTKPTSVSGGKHGKAQGSDLPKEGYVHVRARRGQATNSHSLAERVRREKISERMKFLQDLVPGCNKVTGKAVMLDEIINYVQSLQRQVEFLSMKLATVYPNMEFNVEEYSSKDGFQSHPGAVPFPSPFHPPQNGLMQLGSSSIIAQRQINLPPGFECGTLKHTATQVPGAWDDELHNIVHMGFNSSTPSSQDAKDSSPKAKP